MGKTPAQVQLILAEVQKLGAYCDCELLLNLASPDEPEDDDEDADGVGPRR